MTTILESAETRYRRLFDGVPIGLFQLTPDWQIIDANPALVKMLGYLDRASLCAMRADQIYLNAEVLRRWQELVDKQGAAPGYEVQLRRRNGEIIWAESNARVVREAGSDHTQYYEGSIEEITARKRVEEQLLHNAFHDALTELPNRALFIDHLKLAFERSKRYKEHSIAVLFLDLDRFKTVNDSLGHEAGDRLLIATAHRLKEILRPEDTFARMGGDEFAVLLDNIEGVNIAVHVAERIRREFSDPFYLDKREVFTSASIGIALSSASCDSPEDLLRNADTSMYRAKTLGKARHEVFDQEMQAQVVRLLEIETDLHRAVKSREFCLHFQPIVSLKPVRITGFEALLRWHHPRRGLLYPDEFIPVAEETGLIVEIGGWVLREACLKLTRWQGQYPTTPPLSISVNISSRQFMQPALVEQVEEILKETALPPRSLKLEITESTLMEHSETACTMLKQLQELGVDLVTDDFGTGYSSLSYLHRFPINGLKVDRSFVRRMKPGEQSWKIIRSVILLARSLGIGVVAEGVEEEEQLSYLRSLRCEYGQGNYFSQPLEYRAVPALLSKQSH